MKSKKKKILIIAGARPNFPKIAPLMKEFKKHKARFNVKLVHTGQHYDFQMSDVFFKDLDISKPDIHLNIGSGSHAAQTAKIMIAFETVVLKEKPDLVMVVGDVNSTVACSLVASKLNIKVAHVEAGLRSFDRTMPEELNRIVTDSLSDYLFVTEESGVDNLKKDGISKNKIHFVGNVMIDTLLGSMPKINKSKILTAYSLKPKAYAVLTMHRPSNVDSKESLAEIYNILKEITAKIKIVYPIHPRTKKMIDQRGFLKRFNKLDNLIMTGPQGYIDFIRLVKDSRFVLTDSGGIQEESTVLGVPCLTMRENTERPITIKIGTNYLLGRNRGKIVRCVNSIMANKMKKCRIPEFWDGKTAQRIVKLLKRYFINKLYFED